MEFDLLKVLEMYNEGFSPYEIAEKYGTYPNKIRRILKKHIPMRNRSDAQSTAMERGRKPHPTKGSKIPIETKIKIGKSIAKYWDTMNTEDYAKRVDAGRVYWDSLSENIKSEMRDKAGVALRTAAKEGSRAEKLLNKELLKHFKVIYHKTGLIPNHKLEVDLYLPELNTVIEIDGPSHFLPIWGEERLQKHITADAQKAGLLLGHGIRLLRVKLISKNFSLIIGYSLVTQVMEILNKIKNDEKYKEKFIEIEVK